MTQITFEYIRAELIKSAGSDKARAFAEKIAAQVEARGVEWIESNREALKIGSTIEALEKFAPVSDNRNWFLAAWQVALAK
jgi:hypothetical protein